ncbi:MAG: hypothetical protein J6K51_00060 [Clostridia bacterium]|nr:hypothetical protein [Clostridia bacterium]
MKRKTAVLLIVLAVLLIGIGLLVWWQWNNLTAIRYAMQYTAEQKQEMAEKNEAVMKELTETFSGVDFGLLPEEAKTQLSNGELSEETAVAILTGKLTWEEYRAKETTANGTQTPVQPSRVDDIIAKIYVLRASYTGKIDGLVGQALSDYRAKKGTKSELISRYVSMGYALEGECDAQMEALLSELQTELKRTGEDSSLIGKIRSAYQTEKSLKKASIIEKYQK